MATESHPVTDFLGRTKEILTEKFADIVEALAQKSVEGSLPHTKYLFEIAGLKEEFLRQVQNNGEPTLAELLLAEVKRHRDEATSAPAETGMARIETEGTLCDGTELPDSNYGAKGQ